ncbi:Poly(A) polymerase central domain-containing protein [Massariosphaeria phaeospora]|uniref:Poly(A) polymerase n=1 Tax=Massariosphaeria phaeospora TaxID=100035 RepID=A0A7C8HYJ2_9PLEO|nr:Poly(A) polymerase central domain-containing protein [Massariosphaeria phaeospora]
MDAPQKRQWGITNIISDAAPSEHDLKLNDQLLDTLKNKNNFETSEGTEARYKVLKHLQRVVEEFIRRAAKAKGFPASTVDNGGGKICTFGSYALGAYGPASDIDTLVVAPRHVNMDDFFEHFPPTFKEMSLASDIAEFTAVKDAYVPIIKMEYLGISIDLLFASLPSVPNVKQDMDLLEKGVLRGLDDAAMRSVNGTRVTKELIESVPQVKSFRHALRAIKLWSNQRAIYGAVFGYPGGVAWAIMVARICQLYPFACGATIVSKFFNLMLKWKWPRPVLLKEIEEGSLNLRVWNPTIYPQDKYHLMPVITPAFPSMCSTHTIMHSTKAVMLDEFKRADSIMTEIAGNKKTWDDLFHRHTFFTTDHKYYLSVVATSTTKEAHATFAGLVQSKVRILVKGIDESDDGVKIARPYTKSFDRTHRSKNDEDTERVKQGSLDYMVNDDPELAESVQPTNGDADNGPQTIYTSTWYIGLTLSEGGTKSLDISYPVGEFKRMVSAADSYQEAFMTVRVVHTRSHQLPADVFETGEARPEKAEKRKRAHGKAGKRQFAQTGLDVRNSQPTKSARRTPAP